MTQKPVFKQLIQDLEERDKKGFQTYGREMTTEDGRDTLQDAIEEALDLVVYLTKLRMEREIYEKTILAKSKRKGRGVSDRRSK